MTVHARAINILRADGLVVSLVDDTRLMTGMAACVPAVFAGGWLERAAACGVCAEGTLVEIAGVLRVDLAESTVWTGTIDDDLLTGIPAGMPAAVRDALCAGGKPAGLLGVLWGERPKNLFVQEVRAALSEGRLEALVGLGPGLTPAGDDFLTGALMVPAVRPRVALDERTLAGTTPAGRTLLAEALQGSFPAYLVAFLRSIARAHSKEDVVRAVRAACGHGETSGSDALAGFCWAVSAAGNTGRSSV